MTLLPGGLPGPGAHAGQRARRTRGLLLLGLAAVLVVAGVTALAVVAGRGGGGVQHARAGGVTIAIPEGWEWYPLAAEDLDERLDRADVSPEVEALLRGFQGRGTLFAYDPDDPRSTINVLRQPVGLETPASIVRGLRAQVASAGAEEIRSGLIDLPAGPAAWIAFDGGVQGQPLPAGSTVEQVQYHVIAGGSDHVVTFTGPTVDRGLVAGTMESLRVEPAPGGPRAAA